MSVKCGSDLLTDMFTSRVEQKHYNVQDPTTKNTIPAIRRDSRVSKYNLFIQKLT